MKVAVIYNEAGAEYYVKTSEVKKAELSFKPYFEVDELTPMEEYAMLADELKHYSYGAYCFNVYDNFFSLIDNLQHNKPDVIFNFVEIFRDNARLEMNIAGLYELLKIPYTGAPPVALANCQSKVLAKRMLSASGLNTPKFTVLSKLKDIYRHSLSYPLIVKPAYEDASVGIEEKSIVHNHKKLKERVDYVLTNFIQPALVEEFIDGRELNVAILGDKNPEVLPISEIDFSRMPDHLHNIVSYQAKWDPLHEAYHKTIPICPARLPQKIEAKAKELALNAFKLMGCRDYARIDMRYSNKNKDLYVLEVNPNPDLTEGAGFLRSAEAAGYSYRQALKKIVDFAYQRKP